MGCDIENLEYTRQCWRVGGVGDREPVVLTGCVQIVDIADEPQSNDLWEPRISVFDGH